MADCCGWSRNLKAVSAAALENDDVGGVGSDLRMTDFSLRRIGEIGGCREQKVDV
jgi:hypothetical protein